MDPQKMPIQTLSDIGFTWLYPTDLQNFAIILLLEFILSLKSYEIKLIFKIAFTIPS